MAPQYQPALPPMPLQTLSGALSSPLSSLGSAEAWRELIPQALRRANVAQKEAAYALGISESQFSRQLRGTEHISLWRMFGLPRAFWQEFVLLLIAFYDLTICTDAETLRLAEIGRRVVETQGLVETVRRG